MTSREIPDLPANDYRFMAIVLIDGYGRPRRLEKEFRKTLERSLLNEFGKSATLTLLKRTNVSETTQEVTLCADDPVVSADSPDNPVVED